MLNIGLVNHYGDNLIIVARCGGPQDGIFKNLKNNGIVSDIIPICSGLTDIHNSDDIKTMVVEYYTSKLLEKGKTIDDIDEVYVSSDLFNSFGIFLSLIDKKYRFVEPNDSYKESDWMYDYPYKKGLASIEYCKIQKEYSVLSGKKYPLDTIYLNKKNYVEGADFYDSSWYDRIPENVKSQLVKSFNFEMIDKKNVQLVIENSIGYISGITKNNPVAIYQIIIDLFCDKKHHNVLVKPHPYSSSEMMDLNNYPGSRMFDRMIPIEILCIANVKIDDAFTITSTGLSKISHVVNNSLQLGQEFLNYSLILPYIYTYAKIAISKGMNKLIHNVTSENNFSSNISYMFPSLKVEQCQA